MLDPVLTIALLFSAPLLILTLAPLVWRKRAAPGGTELLLVFASLAIWAALSGLGKLSTDPDLRIMLLKLQFIGVIGVAPALISVALASRRKHTHTEPLGIALIWLPALAFLGLAMTTDLHGLFWSDVTVEKAGALPMLVLETGVAFWAFAAWSYLLIAGALSLLIGKWSRRWSYYRGEALPVLVSVAIPVACNIAFLYSASPNGTGTQPDMTPVFFAVPALALAWSLLFRDGMFDIVRFAQREILDAMAECAIVADVRGRLIFANQTARSKLGITGSLPAPLSEALERHPQLVELLTATADEVDPPENLSLDVEDSSSQAILDLELIPMLDPEGQLTSRVLILRDITRRTQSERRIRALAYYDSLTGLPNRSRFEHLLEHAIERAARNTVSLAVLFLDLDRFKAINDRLGHSAGDQLLKGVAERLRSCVRFSDELAVADDIELTESSQSVSRLAGDEFTILLSDVSQSIDAGLVASRIIEALSLPFQLSGEEVYVGASIGVACYPENGEDADALLRCADRAMYEAKRSGRNRFAFYDQSMNDESAHRHGIEQRLRSCLAGGELELAYQPIRNAPTSEVCGAEALLRAPAMLSDVSTTELINVAEHCGLIHELGRWVFQRACKDLRSWREQELAPPPLAVNVSVQQLRRPEFAQDTLDAIRESGGTPGELGIEITEAALIANDRQIESTLTQLSDAGVQLVLDDFGTSHASVRHLHRFAFSRIKIDRSFISEMTTSREYAQLTAAVVGMARGLGVSVLAEGVETEEQAVALLGYGCNELQGYLIGNEMTADEFARWLSSAKPEEGVS